MTFSIGDVNFAEIANDGWILQSLVGWHALSADRSRDEDRPGLWGTYATVGGERRGLQIEVTGTYLGSSEEEALAAVAALRAATAYAPVTVAFRGQTRSIKVRAVTPVDHHGAETITVKIDLYAADPFLYGTRQSAQTGLGSLGSGMTWPIVWPLDWGSPGETNTLVVDNTDGTAETWADFRVSQGWLSAGFQVQELETGRRLRYEQAVQPTWVIDLLPRIGRARIDEQSDVTPSLTVQEWPVIPAGESRTYSFESLGPSSGSPILQASWAPAHI